MYREQIEQWFEDHREEMVKDIMDLVAIPSVDGRPGRASPTAKARRGAGRGFAAGEAIRLYRCEEYGQLCGHRHHG